jgi:hypothetical protein
VNDLDVVQDLVPDAPLPGPDRLLPARQALLAAATADRPVRGARPARAARAGRRVPRSRYAVFGGLTAAVAAGVAGVLVLAPTATLGGQAPAAQADASTILARATSAAAARPDLVPRADQYLYVRTAGDGRGQHQLWASIDGVHDGLTRMGTVSEPLPGCRGGHRAVYKGDSTTPIGTEDCTPEPAYDPRMPTTAGPMLAYLTRVRGVDGSDVNAFGKAVMFLGEATYLRPRQQAALFQAAGRMAGIVAYPDVTDGAGRHGVGVGWGTVADGRVVLVFDKTSYDYLGLRYYAPGSATSTAASAVLAYRIVNRIGQTG